MFRDSENEEVENEPNDEDNMSIPSEDLPSIEQDPEYMNLITDIKRLEKTLSKGRAQENHKIISMIATGKDLAEMSHHRGLQKPQQKWG